MACTERSPSSFEGWDLGYLSVAVMFIAIFMDMAVLLAFSIISSSLADGGREYQSTPYKRCAEVARETRDVRLGK
jgi:hypothetical protein